MVTDQRQQVLQAVPRTIWFSGSVLLLLGCLYLLAPLAKVFLVIFSGLLFAIFLSGPVRWLGRLLHLPYRLALTGVVLFLAGLLTLFGWVAGPEVNAQFALFFERLPQALQYLQDFLQQFDWLQRFLSDGSPGSVLSVPHIATEITGFFSFTAGVLVDSFIILFLGLYFAYTPELYTTNVVRLFPPRLRPRAREVLEHLGHGLSWWLVGRLSSMVVVGILVTIGLWLIGHPLAIILGIIAGLLAFVPYIGPVLSVLPALLVALITNLQLAFWVLVVYGTTQLLESYLITPLIQEKAVSTPPGLLISVQFLLGVLFGFYGVMLATPLTVTAILLIQMLYFQEVLGEPVHLLDEK